MILVSSCLLGIYSRYDGGSNLNYLLAKYSKYGQYIPVCPEQLGGLGTPRLPVEIINGGGADVLQGKVMTVTCKGDDVSHAFVRGAKEIANMAQMFPIRAAILKERSPSCGVNWIYDGTFSHKVKRDQGVTASLLKKLGIPIYSEEDITEELLLQLMKCK